MADILITIATTLVMTIGLSFVISLIKKGQFEKWGIIAGKLLSKTGDFRFGRSKWEKIEDALLIAFVSFAQGVKKGADLDDTMPDGEVVANIAIGKQRKLRRADEPSNNENVIG